jgi:AcrR family transcriptional regulator
VSETYKHEISSSTVRTKKNPRLPRAERRSQLLEVSRGVFAERGFEAATLEEIAERAGVSRPIVYGHFGDKQRLFEAVVDAEIARVQAAVGAALSAPGEPRELLEGGLRAFFAYVREHPEGHAVLTRDAPIHLSDAGLGVMLDGLAARISDAIARVIRALGLDPAPAPIYANALIGLGAHVGRWWRDHPEVSLAAVTSHTTTLLWSGFGGMLSDPEVRALLFAPPKPTKPH